MEKNETLSIYLYKTKSILKATFLYRETHPIRAVFQALFTMGLVLLLPAFEIIHFVEDTAQKLQEAKVLVEAVLEEVPCDIDDFVLNCDNGDKEFTFDFGEAGNNIAEAVTGAYNEVKLFFQDDRVQYVVDGVVQVTIEYTDLEDIVNEKVVNIQHLQNKLDKYFKYAKAIYSHKHLITKTTIIAVASIALSLSMLLYFIVMSGLLSVVAIIINRLRFRKGIGQLRHRRKLFIAAVLSAIIPTLLIAVVFKLTGTFSLKILFFGTILVYAYTLKTNEDIKI